MNRAGGLQEVSDLFLREHGDFASCLKSVPRPIGGTVTVAYDGAAQAYFITVFDCHRCVVVQSLRHDDPFAAARETTQRFHDLRVSRHALAWSLTPAVDTLAAIGA